MSVAFVLGNGRSRLAILPEELRIRGKIYACNAIYRDFIPDYLIAVDPKMVFELNDKSIQDTVQVWTNYNRRYEDLKGFNYFTPSKGWSSGPTALWFASQHSYSKIFILGFDYLGTNQNKNINNVYSGTHNYKTSTDTATYYGNWYKQTETIIKENPKISYIRVVDDELSLTAKWDQYSNYTTIDYTSFSRVFGLNLQF
jgi:hypothetical protein